MWRNIAKSGHTATYPLFIRLKSYRIPPLLFSRWIQSFTELNIQPVNNHILSLGEVSLYGWHPALFVGIQPVCLCWMDNIIFANNWIWTKDLWYQNRLLYQLSHTTAAPFSETWSLHFLPQASSATIGIIWTKYFIAPPFTPTMRVYPR